MSPEIKIALYALAVALVALLVATVDCLTNVIVNRRALRSFFRRNRDLKSRRSTSKKILQIQLKNLYLCVADPITLKKTTLLEFAR